MQHLRTFVISFAVLAGVSFAAAQTPPTGSPGQSGAPNQLNLNQAQGRAVVNGLRSEQAQPAPSGPQAQVGSQAPDSVTPKAMPNDVTADVPETKNYLFVKLPDRVLIIDPDTKLVAEILLAGDTTGSSPDNTAAPSDSRGQR